MMSLQVVHGRRLAPRARRRIPRWFVAVSATLVWAAGCAPSEVPPPAEVKTVSAYGLTLDESATPEQVVYVLLRAIADDVTAAQAHEHDKQREALLLTYRLGAYSVIEKRLVDVLNQSLASEVKSLGKDRDRRLFDFVKGWAPIASHYVRGFDTDSRAAMARMSVQASPDGERIHVYYPVCHDPQESDPAKRQEATLDIELAKEKAGSRSYWRVARVAFKGRDVPPRVQPVTLPTTSTTPG